MRILLLILPVMLSACTTVRNPDTGFAMPWIAKIPYPEDQPGAPGSASSGVRVYTGTVNGRAVTVISPR